REQRVVELLVLALLEGHVHAAEHHVIRQLRDPATQDRLEAVAMRASVPEELDDLDLAGRHLGADRRGDPAPALAFRRQRRLRMRGGQFDAGETGHREERRQGDEVATERNHRAILSIGVIGPDRTTTDRLGWLTAGAIAGGTPAAAGVGVSDAGRPTPRSRSGPAGRGRRSWWRDRRKDPLSRGTSARHPPRPRPRGPRSR